MGIMARIFKEEPSKYTYYMSGAAFLRVVFMTVLAGAVTWLLAVAFDKWMLTPIFCSGSTANVSICADTTALGAHISAILVGVMTVPLLTLAGVKRPLLVVIAAIASLWGVAGWTGGEWFLSLILTTLIFALVYTALVWLNRIRGNVGAIVFMALFVILTRVVLSL